MVKNFESLRVPKYVQLMLKLKDQIEEGVLKPGDLLPTREKLMQEFGLSLSTVTRAISELERQGWLLSRQGSGTFVAKRSQESSNNQKENLLVGLLIPFKKTFSQDLVTEIVNEGLDNNITIMTLYSPNDEDAELELSKVFMEKGVSALIWYPVEPKKHVSVASLFGKNKIPVIIGDKVSDQFSYPWCCVRSDHASGTLNALKYLYEQGHRRIAYVGSRGSSADFGAVIERWSAYKEFMKSKSLWEPDRLVFDPILFREWHVNATKIENIFKKDNRPTAILGQDEYIALETMRSLKSLHYSIPEQISIIAHGDAPCTSFSEPRVSTVSSCLSEYVDTLITTLKHEIQVAQGEATPSTEREIVVPQRLLLRDSTAGVSNSVIA